ncbi:MAG: hypothetical protein KF832_25900 [Caldilineaceae bacterium]|nr:hypothetical protein [Caldilineaceae bacterium]
MASFVICVSSPSGGGKSAVVQQLGLWQPNAVTLYFDEYDEIAEGATIHPPSLRAQVEQGIDYNAWQMPGLLRDLQQLKQGQAIRSPRDGTLIAPQPLIFLDAAFGRANATLAPYINWLVYIDTPLDVAMARRIQRDYFGNDQADPVSTLQAIQGMTANYLTWARAAYVALEQQVKPQSDLVLDGTLTLAQLAEQILAALPAKVV